MTSPAPACAPSLAVPVAWRLRVDGPLPGAENMRIDEASLRSQKDPDALPLLRLFRWSEPTFSYGRLQSPEKAIALARAMGSADEFVRRPTGGGLVLHDKDLSFSLTWRRDHPGFPKCLKDIYRAVHETARTALRELGADTALRDAAARNGAGEGVCFSEPVEDDLLLDGRKVLGGALRVTGWGRLYQGNILPDIARVTSDVLISRLPNVFETTFFKTPPSAMGGNVVQNRT